MIPEDRLSTTVFRGGLLNPWSNDPKVSHHFGPVRIQDPSEGLLVKLWTLRVEGGSAILSAQGAEPTVEFTRRESIDNVSLSFDQNGRPCICFEEAGSGPYLYWFDPVPNEPTFMPIPGGASTPRITLDDARAFNVGGSDVILAYVREGLLRYRRQRDRFAVEVTPPIGVGGNPLQVDELYHVTMNSRLRLEFLVKDADA